MLFLGGIFRLRRLEQNFPCKMFTYISTAQARTKRWDEICRPSRCALVAAVRIKNKTVVGLLRALGCGGPDRTRVAPVKITTSKANPQISGGSGRSRCGTEFCSADFRWLRRSANFEHRSTGPAKILLQDTLHTERILSWVPTRTFKRTSLCTALRVAQLLVAIHKE